MKVVLLGATKGMGRALARMLVERGDSVFLLGLPDADLELAARDLEARSKPSIKVETAPCDLEQPEGIEPALERADQVLGGFDTVIVTAGLFGTQDRLEQDTDFARRVLTVNFAHTVVFCEHARKRLLSRGGGTLCAFSSVAGDRGRKPVALYGSSKAGLSHYLESIDHKFHDQGLRVVCVKPGFVKTSMTAGLPAPPFAGEPEQVARDVLRAIDAGKPVLYTPFMWRFVMMVIRLLPRFVMRKLSF